MTMTAVGTGKDSQRMDGLLVNDVSGSYIRRALTGGLRFVRKGGGHRPSWMSLHSCMNRQSDDENSRHEEAREAAELVADGTARCTDCKRQDRRPEALEASPHGIQGGFRTSDNQVDCIDRELRHVSCHDCRWREARKHHARRGVLDSHGNSATQCCQNRER